MAEVEVGGEGSCAAGGSGGEAGEEAGDVAAVVVKAGEVGAEPGFLIEDGGDVDEGEEDGEADEDDDAAGGDDEADAEDEGGEVEGIAGEGVGAGGGEFGIFVDVAGGVGAEGDSGEDEGREQRMEAVEGWARQRKTAAKRKPEGTRMRRAMREKFIRAGTEEG